MAESDGRVADLLRENEDLRVRLADAEEHVRAFRAGEVDAVVVYEDQAERIYTLQGADHGYRVMVEQMNEAAVVVAEDLTVLFANANLAKLLGEASEAILGASFERFVPEDERQGLRGLLDRAREGGSTGELALLAGGRRIPARLSLSPVVLGKVDAVCLLITDLTDQKRNERMLAEGRLARAILEQQAEATVICGPDGRILQASRVTERLCGRDPVGEVLESVLPLEWPDGRGFWMGTLRRGQPLQGAHVRLRREGAPALELLLSATVLTGSSGESLGWVLSLVDITEREQARESLRRARDAADAAARAKSEFLANMSHEIRTPMNAVIGFTDLLLGTHLDADQRRFLDLIKNSGEALLDVVNDVLDLAKMEAGRFDFVEEAFDLRDLTEKVARSLGLRAHQKGLELTAHLPFSLPTALVGDPARLRQVLVNLLGNAIKFTERGEVHLGVHVADAEPSGLPAAGHPADTLRLRFAVRDTGIGIPREKLGLLFQSFQQVDSSSTRRHEGTGLGLFISRRIVEQMGGRIEVESVEGAGSTFSFTVPFRVQPGAPVDATELAELRGRRVLVVDDNATHRMIVREMLATRGLAVVLASGGEEALGLLRAAEAAGKPYELMLVDGQMPGMDGLELIERVKGDASFPRPGIVMITSDDLPAHSARARAVGAAACLVKPVVCAELLSVLRSVLAGAGPAREGPTEENLPVATGGRSLRLLLAEDNPVNQLLVRALVEREEWSLDVAEDGRSALAALSRREYDLVLMDVQMPVLDGYEATRSLRALEKHGGAARRTPVVGLTAHALPGDRQRCLDAGMDDYLPKPLDPQALCAVVRRHVRGHETREPAAMLPACLMAVPGLRERIIDQLLAALPRSVAALRDAAGRGAAADVEALAHGLAGSLVVVGAAAAAEAARRVEARAREGRVHEVGSTFEALEDELRRLVACLQGLRGS